MGGEVAAVVVPGDRRGMELKRKVPRRRCCECRSWYVPAPEAAKWQKTCGKECRLLRRAKQAKAQREADLPAVRALERARQRRHRARQADTQGANPPMSQAGLSAQASEAIEEIVEKLGQAQHMSRAGLRRQLHRFALGETARMEAKTGT